GRQQLPRVDVFPPLARLRQRVLLVELDEGVDELAPDGPLAEEVRQLRVVEQPVGVPRRPVGIVPVDDPVHDVVGLRRLVQQVGDLLRASSHESTLIWTSSSRDPDPERISRAMAIEPQTDAAARLARDGGTPARTRPEHPLFPGGMEVGDEELEALERVVRSRNLFRYYGVGEGPDEVAAFEREFAE